MNEKAIDYEKTLQEAEKYARKPDTRIMEQYLHILNANRDEIPVHESENICSRVKKIMIQGYEKEAIKVHRSANRRKKNSPLRQAELYGVKKNKAMAEAIKTISASDINELMKQYRKLRIKHL